MAKPSWIYRAGAVILLLLLLLAGASQLYLPGLVERELETGVAKAFGRVDSIVARVEARPALQMLWGRFPSLQLEARQLETEGLEIEGFFVDARDLAIDPVDLLRKRELTIRSARSLHVTVAVGQDGLNRYLWTKVDPGRMFRVSIVKGNVSLVGQVNILGNAIDLSVGGHFEVRDRNKVAFIPEGLSVEKASVPRFLVDAIAKQWALLLDFSNLPLPIEVQEVRLDSGRLYVYGRYAPNA